ncbi:uncharacterized protein J4E87_010864 [Alternaria ethzedia]|uniref:uncharacterized protein n=1 Tax=Alternaria ethzedia TaxID=181014 RepID=UPI0020C3268A|nr:uncharacterized protein J4E87_010864 [Alternaria ethzedia]KAI4610108.1 hypothetical protein J4E87_010864 [Alternaria ethzedia]
MADPLSIAGSVVGITAAGVQASVKLYALAEKVATASQRVTSIADDISSTCAILNQVRELIIPQPDAQGTLKSVFNTVALSDISHALRRCRSSFTEIETLLRRAFEQVGKRPALRSKIELSRFEKAKWPFLQPQFDELRNDLRDAKSNLVLMIAVASLALAQRNGQQRPIHETERAEFTSTIVHLQRASTAKPQPRMESSQGEERGPRKRPAPGLGSDQSVPDRHTPRPRIMNSAKALSPDPRLDDMSTPLSIDDAHGVSGDHTTVSPANVFLASAGDMQLQGLPSRPNPIIEAGTSTSLKPYQNIEGVAFPEQQTGHALGALPDAGPPDPSASYNHTLSIYSRFGPGVVPQLPYELEHVQQSTSSANDYEMRHYVGWTSNYLHGLATGYGDSVTSSMMKLPQKSLQGLVKTYTDDGNDPHIAMSELTKEQQMMITASYIGYDRPEIVYIRLQPNITVSSVFGMLNVETLKWVIAVNNGGFMSTTSTEPTLPLSKAPFAMETIHDFMPIASLGSTKTTLPLSKSASQWSSTPPIPPVSKDEFDGYFLRPSSESIDSWSTKRPARSAATEMTDADDESDDEVDADVEPVVHQVLPEERPYHAQGPEPYVGMHSLAPSHNFDFTQIANRQVEAMRSQHQCSTMAPAEDNGEDIVNELLARWTTS